jgi:hypothetical protein
MALSILRESFLFLNSLDTTLEEVQAAVGIQIEPKIDKSKIINNLFI